ncbi:Anaphase-promoting complex subunit 10 [Thelohanellus kitauei]|uniref:Anaphase-promoting complex subunit 10 n=1 Tax=Thelohanellus kitauei TaxID=669202 RepID=A0A0C2M426_THEKT|nr:Anaphase-promoting complex subunit 10 [Thelohanellus kitauei]
MHHPIPVLYFPPERGSMCNPILSQNYDVAADAVFVASSTRDGYGIENTRDDCWDTFWQSAGNVPHHIDIIFPRPTLVQHVFVSVSAADESYTPHTIALQAGFDYNDLRTYEIKEVNLGNVWTPLRIIKGMGIDPFEVMMLRVVILDNFTSGMDSRIRQLLVTGPPPPPVRVCIGDELYEGTSLHQNNPRTLR